MRQRPATALVGFPSIFILKRALELTRGTDAEGASICRNWDEVPLTEIPDDTKVLGLVWSTCFHMMLDWKERGEVGEKADEVDLSLGFSLARAETWPPNGWIVPAPSNPTKACLPARPGVA